VIHARLRLAALLVSTLTACAPSSDTPAGGRVDVGLPVPNYRAVTITGDSVGLTEQRGKVVLFNIWATWCHPCRDEIPELRSLHERYNDRGLEVVGVSVDAQGAEDNVREFMSEFRMHYPVWLDPDERVSTQFLAPGVPATYLIDRRGVLRWRKTGPILPGDTALVGAIERALQAGA